MLEKDPAKRITLDEALKHPFFSNLYDNSPSKKSTSSDIENENESDETNSEIFEEFL